MKKKKLKLLALPLAIASASVIGMVSGTLAYFTSMDKATVSIEAGQVKVDLAVDGTSLKLFSLGVEQTTVSSEDIGGVATDVVHFENGGYAYVDGAKIVLKKITPGDKVSFNVKVYNRSNVDIKYRLLVEYDDIKEGADPHDASVKGFLSDALVATNLDSSDGYQTALLATKDTAIVDKNITLELPAEAGNAYQNAEVAVYINVDAQQYNKPVDTSQGYANSYQDTAGHWTHEIVTPAQVDNMFASTAAIEEMADGEEKEAAIEKAKNSTFKLMTDVDLSTSTSVGTGTLYGTFDGDGHTIKNANVTGSNNVGLFAKYYEDATIKNVNLRNVKISGAENVGLLFGQSYPHAAGADATVAGSKLTVENVNIDSSCSVEGVKGVGGLSGSARWTEELVLKNIVNEADVIAYNWNVGGFYGTLSGVKKITIENCENHGKVLGTKNVGGFLGQVPAVETLVVKDCLNTGEIAVHNIINAADDRVGFFLGYVKNGVDATYTNNETTGKITYKASLDRATVIASCFEKDFINNGIAVEAGKTYEDYIVPNSIVDFNIAKDANNDFVGTDIPGAVRYQVTMFMYGRTCVLDEDKVMVIRETSVSSSKSYNSVAEITADFGYVTRAGYVLEDTLTEFAEYREGDHAQQWTSTYNGRAYFFRVPEAEAPTTLNYPYKDPTTGEWFFVIDAEKDMIDGRYTILSPKDTYVNYIFTAFDENDEMIASKYLENSSKSYSNGCAVKNLKGREFKGHGDKTFDYEAQYKTDYGLN